MRLTTDEQYLSGWDAVPVRRRSDRVAAVRSAATTLPEVVAFEAGAKGSAGAIAATLTALNAELAEELASSQPVDRRWQSDGREIQGWLYPAGSGRQPLALEIHGGPHTLYGWRRCSSGRSSPAPASRSSRPNPRGSEGYGEAFNRANLGDWGDGPMARRPRRHRPGDRRRARRPRAARRDRRLVRRLPDQLDRRQAAAVQGGGHLPLVRRHAACCSSPATSRAASGRGSSSAATRGTTTAYFYDISPLRLAPRHPDAAAHPALRARPAHDGRPGRGAVQRPALAQAAGPVHARARGVPRAHPVRHAVPARREPAQVRDWFAHFLVARRARACRCPAEEPRRALGRSTGRVLTPRQRRVSSQPMTTSVARDSATRERAHELIRAYDRRAGSLGTLLGRVTPVDQVGVQERVASLQKRSIKKASKVWALDLAIRMMDLTTLEGKDTPGKVRALCAEGDAPEAGRCLDPARRRDLHLPDARRRGQGGAQGSGVKVASVADGLPVGPVVPRHQARRDAGGGRRRRRRDRHGHRPRRLPRGRLPGRVRGDRRDQGRRAARRTSRSSSRRASWARSTTCAGRRSSRWRPARTSSRPRPARSCRPRRCRSRS